MDILEYTLITDEWRVGTLDGPDLNRDPELEDQITGTATLTPIFRTGSRVPHDPRAYSLAINSFSGTYRRGRLVGPDGKDGIKVISAVSGEPVYWRIDRELTVRQWDGQRRRIRPLPTITVHPVGGVLHLPDAAPTAPAISDGDRRKTLIDIASAVSSAQEAAARAVEAGQEAARVIESTRGLSVDLTEVRNAREAAIRAQQAAEKAAKDAKAVALDGSDIASTTGSLPTRRVDGLDGLLDTMATRLDTKVDESTTSVDPTGGSVARRSADGHLHVPTDPTADNDAASKAYVDSKVTSGVEPAVIPAYAPRFGYIPDQTSTHRAAIQAALDEANPGDTVDLGPYTYTLTDKTKSYPTADGTQIRQDRILVKPPGVSIVGNDATLKIADNFGTYAVLIGTRQTSEAETTCTLSGFTIDYNARGGNTMPKSQTSVWPRVGVYLTSYLEGSRITVDVAHHDADNTNCVYVAANHLVFPTHYSTDTGRHATEHHDHSTYYTKVTVNGGTQTWGPGSHQGGGYSSNTAIELHGGTITMAPWSVDRFIKAMNICGSDNVPDGSDITVKGLTATRLCGGILVWNFPSVGRVRSLDLDLNLTIDRDWYPGDLANTPAPGISMEPNSSLDLDSLRIRGMIRYRPSTKTVSNDRYSAGIAISESKSSWAIGDLDIDATITDPYAVGLMLSATIRGGRVRLAVTNPGSTTTLKAAVSVAKAVRDTKFDIDVYDTHATRATTHTLYVDRTAELTRTTVHSRSYFTDESSTASFFQAGWVSPSVQGATGLESHSVGPGWRGAPGTIAGGSTHRDTVSGKTWVQTDHPAGSTWRALAPTYE